MGEEWEVWFIKNDIYGNPLIHRKFGELSWETLHEIQEIIEKGINEYIKNKL